MWSWGGNEKAALYGMRNEGRSTLRPPVAPLPMSAQVRLFNPPPNQEVQYEKSSLDSSGEDYWTWATGSDSSGWSYQSVASCFEYDREVADFLKGMEEFLVYRPLPSSVVWSGSMDVDEERRTSSANFWKENI